MTTVRLETWSVAQIEALLRRTSSLQTDVTFLINNSVYQQKAFTVASSIWLWDHNLGRRLAGVQAYDSDWNLIGTDIQESTTKRIVATHLANITGFLVGS